MIANTFVVVQRISSGMDDADEAISFRFTAPHTGNVEILGIFIGGITGTSPTYRFGLQGDDDGVPDGSYIQSTTFSGWVQNTYHNLSGFSSPVVAGQVYHFVFQYESGTIDSGNRVQVGWMRPAHHLTPRNQAVDEKFDVLFSTDGASSWSLFGGSPHFVIEYDDGTVYGNPFGFTDVKTITATTWARQKITVDADITINGLRVRAARDSADPINHELVAEIWDSSETILASVTVSSGNNLNNYGSGFTNNTVWVGATLTTPLILTAAEGTYYLVIKANKTAGAGESDFILDVIDTTTTQRWVDTTYKGGSDSFLQTTTNSGGSWADRTDQDMPFELVEPTVQIVPRVKKKFRKEKRYYFISNTKSGEQKEVTANWDFDSITREINGTMYATITTDKNLDTFRDGSTEVANNLTIRLSTDKTGPDGLDYFSGYIPQRTLQVDEEKEIVQLKAFGHASKLYRAVWRDGTTTTHDYSSSGQKASEIAKDIIDDYRALDSNANFNYSA